MTSSASSPSPARPADQLVATPEQLRAQLRQHRQATPAERQRLRQTKGRQVDAQALAEVQALIGPTPPEGHRRDLLIEHLHRLQDQHHGLFDRHLVALAQLMRLSLAEVHEVASFYHHFERLPDGAAAPALTVRVCEGLSCALAGAPALQAELAERLGPEQPGGVRLRPAPCMGLCDQAPAVMLHQAAIPHATADQVLAQLQAGRTSPAPSPTGTLAAYRAQGGYALLQAVVGGTPSAEQVLQTLEAAQLRGLGGAGFPAGRKWRIVRDQPAPRLLVVNIDEGEPGTFKDRHYLMHDPHRLLEGLLIAAHVVGAAHCYLYLRDEYHDGRLLLQAALAELQADPPCPLPPIDLRRGAGAYICGEESALLESLEGKRGEPRLRPPYIAQVGLFGRPTLAHNLETLYWVRDLLQQGPEAFRQSGRHGRLGWRSFSVSGRVRQPGVKLAPAGITLRELVDEYCGGMAEGHTLYAYLPGGASGGILPARLADVPLDFDTLAPHGALIGSAAVIVLGQHDSARAAALNMMRFFAHESCGQCTPCRVGTDKAAQLMAQPVWDEATLQDLAQVMADASICGLGQAAPNPLRSVLQYFPEELAP